MIKEFEFYSVLKEENEQNLDTVLGLGFDTTVADKDEPGYKEDEGVRNILTWLEGHEYIRQKVVGIYLGIYDGTSAV